MVFQHQASTQIVGHQYYASAPQPMACQQPWLTVQQPQPMVQQPWPMIYQLQQLVSYQLQTSTLSPTGYQPHQTDSWQPQESMHIPAVHQESTLVSRSIVQKIRTQVSDPWPMTQLIMHRVQSAVQQQLNKNPLLVSALLPMTSYSQQPDNYRLPAFSP